MNIAINHPFFLVHKSFLKLTQHLFKHTPISYLDYERYYYDGYTVGLHQIAEFSHQIVAAQLMPNLEQLHHTHSHCVCLSSDLPLPKVVIDQSLFLKNIEIAQSFDIHHRLCLNFSTDTYVEVFVFGLGKQVADFYNVFLNELKKLEDFCVYFREIMSDLILDIYQNRIKFEITEEPVGFQDLNGIKNELEHNFISNIKLDKYRMSGKNGQVSLTKREFECLLWCSKGNSAKQIARILSLSPRTVEIYLAHLKEKLGCQSKFELIDIALRSPFIKAHI